MQPFSEYHSKEVFIKRNGESIRSNTDCTADLKALYKYIKLILLNTKGEIKDTIAITSTIFSDTNLTLQCKYLNIKCAVDF